MRRTDEVWLLVKADGGRYVRALNEPLSLERTLTTDIKRALRFADKSTASLAASRLSGGRQHLAVVLVPLHTAPER